LVTRRHRTNGASQVALREFETRMLRSKQPTTAPSWGRQRSAAATCAMLRTHDANDLGGGIPRRHVDRSRASRYCSVNLTGRMWRVCRV
jgi:hypothetical protein